MAFESIRSELTDEGVLILTLNDPATRNALGGQHRYRAVLTLSADGSRFNDGVLIALGDPDDEVRALANRKLVELKAANASQQLLEAYDKVGSRERSGLLRVLAEHGVEGGEVFHPSDVALEDVGSDDCRTRLVAVDRDGERVQVFTLAGTCYGAFDV